MFGFYSNWSGQSFYDDWYITNYNLIFTAFTISYLGVFEQDVRFRKHLSKQQRREKLKLNSKIRNKLGEETNSEAEDMESMIPIFETRIVRNVKDNFQHYYYMSQRGLFYSMQHFWVILIESLCQSCLLTFSVVDLPKKIHSK